MILLPIADSFALFPLGRLHFHEKINENQITTYYLLFLMSDIKHVAWRVLILALYGTCRKSILMVRTVRKGHAIRLPDLCCQS